jgi:hypothetical protein
MAGPAQSRRVAVLLSHVSSGGEEVATSLHRQATAAQLAPLPSRLQPGDAAALCRLLDHDNHEMRAAMKDFMKGDLYKPVRLS